MGGMGKKLVLSNHSCLFVLLYCAFHYVATYLRESIPSTVYKERDVRQRLLPSVRFLSRRWTASTCSPLCTQPLFLSLVVLLCSLHSVLGCCASQRWASHLPFISMEYYTMIPPVSLHMWRSKLVYGWTILTACVVDDEACAHLAGSWFSNCSG